MNTFCYNACTKTTVMITDLGPGMDASITPPSLCDHFMYSIFAGCGSGLWFCTALIIPSLIFHWNLIFGSDIGHEMEKKGPKKSSNWRRTCRLLYRARYSSFFNIEYVAHNRGHVYIPIAVDSHPSCKRDKLIE